MILFRDVCITPGVLPAVRLNCGLLGRARALLPMNTNCGLRLRMLTLGPAFVKICVPSLVSVTRVKRPPLANSLTEKVPFRARGSRV